MNYKKKVLITDGISQKTKEFCQREILPQFDLIFSDEEQDCQVHIATADVLVTFTKGISKEMLAKAAKCIYIQKLGAGVNNIAIAEASERGIPVGNVAGTNARSVAEYAVMLMLAVIKHIKTAHNKLAREGQWLKTVLRDSCYELSYKKVGVIGLGNIGRQTVRLLKGFECEISYYDSFRLPVEIEKELGVSYRNLDTLLQESDIISIHVPLMAETHYLIDKEQLLAMKPNAILINTSRGGVVNEQALVEVLEAGHLLGAGIDVFENEPADNTHPLAQIERVILSPHNGGGTNEAIEAVIRDAFQNINSVLKDGKVANEKTIVNWQDLQEKTVKNKELVPLRYDINNHQGKVSL